MAIIVDKDKKRKNIAIACTELLLEKGIKNLRVSEIAKTAGIGKATVYDYFENKEAVVFEIIRNLIKEHQKDLISRSDEKTSCKQKVLYLFDFYLCEYKDYKKHLEMYKEYISVTLAMDTDAMSAFNYECTEFLKKILTDIINEGIRKGEIIPRAKQLITGIMATERGFMLTNWTENRNLKSDFKTYINTLFDLIETKK